MTIFEFIELYSRCQVTARLCIDTVELTNDEVLNFSSKDYDRYRQFISESPPYWIVSLYNVIPIISYNIVWSEFTKEEWDKLVLLKPEWKDLMDRYYRKPII